MAVTKSSKRRPCRRAVVEGRRCRREQTPRAPGNCAAPTTDAEEDARRIEPAGRSPTRSDVGRRHRPRAALHRQQGREQAPRPSRGRAAVRPAPREIRIERTRKQHEHSTAKRRDLVMANTRPRLDEQVLRRRARPSTPTTGGLPRIACRFPAGCGLAAGHRHHEAGDRNRAPPRARATRSSHQRSSRTQHGDEGGERVTPPDRQEPGVRISSNQSSGRRATKRNATRRRCPAEQPGDEDVDASRPSSRARAARPRARLPERRPAGRPSCDGLGGDREVVIEEGGVARRPTRRSGPARTVACSGSWPKHLRLARCGGHEPGARSEQGVVFASAFAPARARPRPSKFEIPDAGEGGKKPARREAAARRKRDGGKACEKRLHATGDLKNNPSRTGTLREVALSTPSWVGWGAWTSYLRPCMVSCSSSKSSWGPT